MSNDEETYSTIFTALRHPIRRRILRMLSGEPMTFTNVLNALGIESSHLTYHLENLGVLISKTDSGKYRLSTFGQAAVSMMGWVEDVPKTAPQPSILTSKWPMVLVVLMVSVAVFASAYYGQSQFNELFREYTRLSMNFTQLNLDYAQLSENYTHISLEYAQLAKTYTQLKDEYLSTIAPTTISPPISKLEAIHLALEHDGWNETTLQDMFVNAKLCYVKLTITSTSKSYGVEYYLTEPVLDYSPVYIGDTTYRYVWMVIVSQQGFSKSIPPPGCYWVDVATGEVVTTPFDRYNPHFND